MNFRSSSLKLVCRDYWRCTFGNFTERRARLRLYRLQQLGVSNVVKRAAKILVLRDRDREWWRRRRRLLRSCGRRRYLSLACWNPHYSISSPPPPLSYTKIPTESRLVPCTISFFRSLHRHYRRAVSLLMLLFLFIPHLHSSYLLFPYLCLIPRRHAPFSLLSHSSLNYSTCPLTPSVPTGPPTHLDQPHSISGCMRAK